MAVKINRLREREKNELISSVLFDDEYFDAKLDGLIDSNRSHLRFEWICV
jgi:hypothetical protein